MLLLKPHETLYATAVAAAAAAAVGGKGSDRLLGANSRRRNAACTSEHNGIGIDGIDALINHTLRW